MVLGALAVTWAACGTDPGVIADVPPEAQAPEGGIGFTPSDGAAPDGSLGTCETGCVQGALCKYGVCVPDLGVCKENGDCPGDAYCDDDHTCVPYGVPPDKINDPSCSRRDVPGDVQPEVQCEWVGPPAGDPTSNYTAIYTAPMVADLNLDLDPNKLQPSIVVTTFTAINGERIGMLRVFDGRTCTEQMRIGGPDDPDVENNRPAYGTQWAIGDLDGDVGTPNGHPEIVGLHRTSGNFGTQPPLSLVAFKIEVGANGVPRLARKWTGRICGATPAQDQKVTFASNEANYGPGIWDVDDDGKPEVVVDKNVFDANGCLLNPPATFDPYLRHGVHSTVADVDLDGQPDLVRANGIYGWDKAQKNWVLKPWFTGTGQKPGHVAVADFGRYSTIPGKTASDPLPEVVVVSAETTTYNPQSSGTVRIQNLRGETVFGPHPLFKFSQPHGGHGGTPTVADFDGDGYPEFATAANEFYTVYDPDCTPGGSGDPARPGGTCMRPAYMSKYAGGPVPLDGVLWAQPSQDYSSSETGSSVFDFNGDGKAEVVYRDECYLRVYEGADGKVLFSYPAVSGTGQELPVIADVDGDFATEIVVPRAHNGPACPAKDPLLEGSGVTSPPFEYKNGFLVLRDPQDRWVASRPIWNQHAYSITNVTDDGRIPKASSVLRNWEQPGMNNFRQNAQGELGALALADLTVQMEGLSALCSGRAGPLSLTSRVCNRGTNPVQDGATIAFYAVPKGAPLDPATAPAVCTVKTATLLTPGTCTSVSCTGEIGAGDDVYVVADPAGEIADCHPGNNVGASARVLCPAVK